MFIDEFISKIEEFDNIIIHRHQRPDGDCMGSQIGLKEIILYSYPNKHVYAVGDNVPDYLNYVGKTDVVDDALYQESLVIVVDTSNEQRIYDDRWKTGKYIVKIDHHDDSPEFGNISYVDPESPACANIIVRLVNESNGKLKLNKAAATALYFGITTDTGRFRYRGVDGEVLRNAGLLVDAGADIQDLYKNLYVDELNTLKLQGYVLNHFKSTPNGVVYIFFTKRMMKHFGVTKEEAGNLINTLSSIRGCLAWVAFIDQMQKSDKTKEHDPAKEIRCRIRSRDVAINGIAANFRGGGHLQAAGATIYSKKEMKQLLEQLDATVKKYKEENPNAF